jgi:hypothetical protein
VVGGENEPQTPPPFVHVIASNVDGHTPLPQDGVIRVAFDRFLNPLSVNRQGVILVDEFGNVPGTPPIVTYDPVVRVVTLSNPTPGATWLTVGQFYKLQFPVSPADASFFGLRAIDGATIDPSQPQIGFTVAPPTGNPPVDPKIDFCADIFPLFAAKRSTPTALGACAAAGCHGDPSNPVAATTAEGLLLATEDGIRQTALGVEAHEATTAAPSTPLPPEPAFPTGMPIIDPGNPGDSYLLYKLLVPDTDGAPSASGSTFPYTACRAITPPFDYGLGASLAPPDEATRLSAHVIGRRMPWGGTALGLDELERIRLWIQEGAEVDDCSACPASAP